MRSASPTTTSGQHSRTFRGPLDIVLGVIAVLIVVAFLIYLHRAEDRFAERAEEAFPGDLDDI